MKRTTTITTLAVGAVCALGGAGLGIAGAGAHHGNVPPGHAMRIGQPVHADLVVPDRQGGFQTVTLDRGTVSSVNGDQLTINEGTPTATYKSLTLTIPGDAKVWRDRQSVQLTDLQQGDFVAVIQAQGKTLVKAFSAQAAQQGDQQGARDFRTRHR